MIGLRTRLLFALLLRQQSIVVDLPGNVSIHREVTPWWHISGHDSPTVR